MLEINGKTVAIIDSGIGGLSVLNNLMSKFKCGNYIYYADNLNMPYGNKSKQFIAKRVKTIINELKEKYNVGLVIIACNTASSILKDEYIEGVKTLKFCRDRTYLATPLTKKVLNQNNVIADSKLASLIEKNINNGYKLNQIVKNTINKHKLYKYKEIILGCTHYELVYDLFKNNLKETNVICNSSYLIDDIIINHNELNLVILLSKQTNEYEKLILKTLKRLN